MEDTRISDYKKRMGEGERQDEKCMWLHRLYN